MMPYMDPNTTDDGRPAMAQELLDLILDHLHYDLASLKQCARASRSLLPTCQRHLFSTYQITKSNADELAHLFTLPVSTDRHDESDTLQARVADLLNTYTENLILTGHSLTSRSVWDARLPEFKNVQKITFKGGELHSAITIPSFLVRAWTSPSFKIRSVEFDFRFMSQKGVVESLCVLPTVVEDISLIGFRAKYNNESFPASSFRQYIEDQLPSGRPRQEAHQFNGTLKFRLPTDVSETVLPVLLELGDWFKFNLKRINYRVTLRAEMFHLASLVDKCKTSLESLDITVSFPSAYRVQPDVVSEYTGS